MRKDLDPELIAENPQNQWGNRYISLKCLGVSAQAETFLVEDSAQSGLQVVRKFLNAELTRDQPDLLNHLARLAQLDHPALARVTDFGVEGERIYLCREAIPGPSLLEVFKTAAPEQSLSLIAQLLAVLESLHAQNILHLDLKPSNIFVEQTIENKPQLKLVDYGLSQLFYPPSFLQTEPIGTPPYTAPEYAMLRYPDVRSDLYSVGVYLYYALTKRLPFSGRDLTKIREAQLKQAPTPPQSPYLNLAPKLAAIVQKLLELDPNHRYSGPHAVLCAFAEAIERGFPKVEIPWPPLLADPDLLFRPHESLKVFRKMILQGGRWAVLGPSGSGKTFFSRWIERMFWLNQRRAVRLSGSEIGPMEGERGLNPGEPLFLLVDDADEGPVEPWLHARPYRNVVVFGRDIPWASAKQRWNAVHLEGIDISQTGNLLKTLFGKVDSAPLEVFQKLTVGNPSDIVQQTQGFERKGVVKRIGHELFLDTEQLRSLKISSKSDARIFAMTTLSEFRKKLLAGLTLAQVPLSIESLVGLGAHHLSETASVLQELHQEALVLRRVVSGKIYYQANLPVEWSSSLSIAQPLAWIEALVREEFFAAALRVLLQVFSPAQLESPELALLYASLLESSDNNLEVLRIVTAKFVNQLSHIDQGRAYATLGRALLKMGRLKQAESAFQRNLNLMKNSQDPVGRFDALVDLGDIYQRGGEIEKAIGFYREAYPLLEQISVGRQSHYRGYLETSVARLYFEATDFEQARPRFEEAVRFLLPGSPSLVLAKAYFYFAELEFQDEAMDQAANLARKGLSLAVFKRDWELQGRLFLLLSKIAEHRGSSLEQGEALSSAVFALERIPPHRLHGQALAERAAFFEIHRQFDLAKNDAEKVLSLASQTNSPDLEGRAEWVLARLARRDPIRSREAVERLAKAMTIFEKANDFRMQGECQIEFAEMQRFNGDVLRAKQHYRSALQCFDRALQQLGPGTHDARQAVSRKQFVEIALEALP